MQNLHLKYSRELIQIYTSKALWMLLAENFIFRCVYCARDADFQDQKTNLSNLCVHGCGVVIFNTLHRATCTCICSLFVACSLLFVKFKVCLLISVLNFRYF